MHSLCMVVGERPDEALAPFADYLKVEKYKSFLEPADVTSMAEHFGLSAQDLPALAGKLREWHGAEGGIDGGRLLEGGVRIPLRKTANGCDPHGSRRTLVSDDGASASSKVSRPWGSGG
jgi:hypothetical protein